MPFAADCSALFARDLTRLQQEIQAFTSADDLWRTTGGVSNSAGHLTLHLEGNLREYVGRQLGRSSYDRNRALEFSSAPLPKDDLLARISQVQQEIPAVVGNLDEVTLESQYPEDVLKNRSRPASF